MSHPDPYGNLEKTSSINGAYRDESFRDAQNVAGTSGRNWHKSGTRCSASVPLEIETPDALAGATGAKGIERAFRTEQYGNRAAAATALGHAIAACDPEDAVVLMEAALDDLRAGLPGGLPRAIMAEARFWAEAATRTERKAYALASFNHLSAADQRAFLAHVGGRPQ